MKSLLADFFRILFKISFFKKRFFGIHEKLIQPGQLFKGVHKDYYHHKKIRFHLDLNDWIQENIYLLGEYEPDELRTIISFLKPGDIFIDVGANIGWYTLNIAERIGPAGKVIAFEPYPSTYDHLQKNISMNDFRNIVAEQMALAGYSGSVSISLNKNDQNSGGASIFLSNEGLIEAKTISLDQYVKEIKLEQVNFIKLDIEGAEYLALKGMQDTLERFSPLILIEIDETVLATTPYSSQQVRRLLASYGYNHFIQPDPSSSNYLYSKIKLQS